ncbi:hypothetical protein ABAC460_14910 [Asticcacaulis sp. AC460]|uniref:hypothetical protein n=1 Tax=Asticcacaulis sp. AC460 TaxID=1282360 RepID=UPI0003C3EB6D|nr:hypothetical protein [Asticcacaulis sp. AC460]ESQ88738.1 hypothetical protein ABAC460_14910 [Asticcacaulis sp. AC460]
MPESANTSEIVEGAFCPLPFPVVRWLMMAGLCGLLYLPAFYLVLVVAGFLGFLALPMMMAVGFAPLVFMGVYLYAALRHRKGSPRSLRQPTVFSLIGTLVLIPFIWMSGLTLFATILNLSGLGAWLDIGGHIA